MNRLFLAAGVAALAIAAPAVSKPDGGNKGGGGAAKVERGGGGHKAHGAGDGGGRAFKAERRGGGQAFKAERRGGSSLKAERGSSLRFARAERGEGKRDRSEFRIRGKNDDRRIRMEARGGERVKFKGRDRQERFAFRGKDRDLVRQGIAVKGKDWNRDRDLVVRRDWDDDDRWVTAFARGRGVGCPPGLANKNPACMPPGQYKKIVGSALPAAYASSLVPEFLRDIYRDDDDYYYRYNDGYVYRVDRDRDLIETLIPLFGGGLMLGQPFPAAYSSFGVPSYYQSFYPDTADDYYRYANGYVYEVDRDTGLIEDMIPLYDRGYGVGQMLPPSYSYYNLPYPYRNIYADNDDYYYRYAPGAIYQVDRDTSLITSVVSLLSGGLGVGQPLPIGYDMYNVPYAYRDQYYDTPDAWYRYANGNIYQVDPTTRLITAVIDAIV